MQTLLHVMALALVFQLPLVAVGMRKAARDTDLMTVTEYVRLFYGIWLGICGFLATAAALSEVFGSVGRVVFCLIFLATGMINGFRLLWPHAMAAQVMLRAGKN